ncbi:hypothetical protein EJ06DRAFT_502315 [Trichodelitschia bisporula]|uniref:LYC1 C-terminal domain-containing protein n=1 Tax=Trichodelitschia bisporula TaxID=703511 RepID=A0A6G1IAV6_9PEZI|nr:hypothetical protein EJ06DRAFT_502315 [Trichodelitschia bisporula]
MNGLVKDLPDSRSPALGLVQPTEEEKLRQMKANAVAWRGALSLDAYLKREKFLASRELTQNGGLTYWALVDKAAKERLVLAGCETYRKRAIVAQNGTVKDVWCHGIGSVFCPPELRRRGYAARMLKELGEALKIWQADERESLFSVLYSDIGKEFYAALGWEPFKSAHISVPCTSQAIANELHDPLSPVHLLYADDLPDLCADDEKLIRQSMKMAPSGKVHVAVVPDVETILWHHAREEFVAQELYRRAPDVKGAMVFDESGKRVWCYWTRMWYNEDPTDDAGNTLHVLRLVVEGEGTLNWETQASDEMFLRYVPSIAALIGAASQEARAWNMANVEIWNPTKIVIEAAKTVYPSAEMVHRDSESIASLRWYGERLSVGPVGSWIDWLGNEKYAWC